MRRFACRDSRHLPICSCNRDHRSSDATRGRARAYCDVILRWLRQNRNVDSTAELSALAGLNESRDTQFASRRVSLPDLGGAFRQTNAAPRCLLGAGPTPVQHNQYRTALTRPCADLRQNFVPELPSGVSSAVIDRLKALRGPGRGFRLTLARKLLEPGLWKLGGLVPP